MQKLKLLHVPVLSLIAIIMTAGILHLTAVVAVPQPAQLSKVEIKPTTIEGGKPIEVVIRMTKKANTWVKLNSSNNNIIPVPANMPVQIKNVSSKSIFLDTNVISGSSQFVTIYATTGAVQKYGSVSVRPVAASGGAVQYSIYKIKSNNMAALRRLAASKGYRFDSEVESGSAPFPECSQTTTPSSIRLTASAGGPPGQAVDVTCKFRLFGGQTTLKSGWTLDKLVWSKITRPGTWSYHSAPKFDTNNPSFIVRMTSNFLGPSAYLDLREVWLKGPKGATWKDAFE